MAASGLATVALGGLLWVANIFRSSREYSMTCRLPRPDIDMQRAACTTPWLAESIHTWHDLHVTFGARAPAAAPCQVPQQAFQACTRPVTLKQARECASLSQLLSTSGCRRHEQVTARRMAQTQAQDGRRGDEARYRGPGRAALICYVPMRRNRPTRTQATM
jgi:hypothetical protein